MIAAMPRCWRDFVAVHPVADLFPMLDDTSLDELAADIGVNGLRLPLVQWQADGDAP